MSQKTLFSLRIIFYYASTVEFTSKIALTGVILSFAKDLNFCEIQYRFILSDKRGKFCMFWKICLDKSVSVSEGELSDN